MRRAPLAGLLLAAVLALGGLPAAADAPAGVFPLSPGDLTCDHALNGSDSLALTRHIAGLSASVIAGCPGIGSITNPTNGLIAFSDESGDIWVVDADGGNPTNITNSPGVYDEFPSWSPDGTRILFDSAATGHYQLYTMKPDGSDVQRLTNSALDDSEGFYSPDGQTVVFNVFDEAQPRNDVYTIHADGTHRQDITTDNPGDDFSATWSPDGQRLVFSTDRHGNYVDLYTMDPDGTNATPLVLDLGYSAGPSWSPDGSRILFSNYNVDGTEVWVVSAAGGQPVMLTNAPGRDSAPGWAPDGTAIVFTSERLEPDPDNCDSCHREVYRMDGNGDNQMLVVDLPGEQYDPSWQPLGRPFGDLNCDGLVNGADVMISLQAAAILPLDLPTGCDPP